MFQNKFLKNYFILEVCQIYLLNWKTIFILNNRKLFSRLVNKYDLKVFISIFQLKIFENKTKIKIKLKIIQELGIVSFKFV